jgi:hypothetical protein
MHQGGNKPKVPQQYDAMEVTTKEAKANEKFIHILIFKCEADWAFAMNMKQAMSKQESNAKH